MTLWAGEVFCLVGRNRFRQNHPGHDRRRPPWSPDQRAQGFRIDRDMDDWIKRDYRSLASRIGVIYQNPAEAVSHRFTVFDIVAEPLRIRKRRVAQRDEIRDRVLARRWPTSACPPRPNF